METYYISYKEFMDDSFNFIIFMLFIKFIAYNLTFLK